MKLPRQLAHLTIFLIVFVNSWNSFAQGTFSGDKSAYHDELDGYMQSISDIHEPILNEFLKAWETDSLFTEEEQQNIINLSQLMIEHNARPYPHFVSFISGQLAFKYFSTDPENYENWIEGLEKVLKNKKTKTQEIKNILEFTDILLRKNLIYESNATAWRASDKNYKILNKKQLRVEFEDVDLICYAKRDSMHLFNTKGTVYPAEYVWKGEGGLVTWERGGYIRDEVFAIIKEYTIELKKSEYYAEDVEFTNKLYFDEPLKGVLHDKVKYNISPERATYPQFDSYTKEFAITDMYENIDYEGGLSMQGAKLVGTGTLDKLAKLKIFRNDTLVLTAASKYFGFRSDRVSSQRTIVTILLKKDSIYHPDLFFTYRVANRELTLLKTDNYSSRSPYFNSYHKVDMNFDQLSWKMDEDVMNFTAPRGAAIGTAYFESVNYFNYEKFIAMMMMDQAHPLVTLKKFGELYGSDEFPVDAFADYLSMPLHQVQQMAMRMAFNGFVFYDVNNGTIRLKPRLYDYLDASINRIDYDVIGFESRVEAPLENAVYNIRTDDLIINGIPQIQVSDSQNVIIYPKYNRIILKNNRNFQFDGVVEAGLLTFYGSNFFFSYDSFKVNLQNVDSLHIEFLTGQKDNYGLPISEHVKNQLQYITGEILIDEADNKSGRKSNPEYPIFISKENSYVFYEQDNIQGGVYEANDFFFEVYPFVMDSLDNFNYRDLLFKGEFVSAGIFPTFEKELTLQPDNSLGFRHKTPPEGYPIYQGKGAYDNEIWLSNKGLKGDGKLEYLTSTTLSNDFNFFPDSMNTQSAKFDIALKTTETQFPMVYSLDNYIHWLPYADEMYANKTTTDFTLFNDSTKLNGNLLLQPTGLSGGGKMDLKNSDLHSDLFTYKAYDIFSDTADFFLKSLNTEGYTVISENINAHINYQQQKGWFRSNEDFSLVNFPDNKYVSYIDYFIWDMMKHELAMGSQAGEVEVDYTYEDVEPEGPRYISLHHDQDSLNFVSPLAYYDYENNYINAKGVKFIEVADSRIYPNQGEVTVERDAKMRTLEDARIRTNKITKLHTIHSATLHIEGKNYYSGFGNYDYVDENDKIQNIHLSEIKVDTGLHTVANGDIYEEANFKLSPVYQFLGKASLFADDSLLTFKGGVKIEHNCENPVPEWLYFTTRIDPDDIYIPIPEEAVDINRNKVYSGMYIYYDSVHIYPSFISMHKSYSDRAMVSSNGYMYYDKAQHLFKIGSEEKIHDFTLPEDYLSLHREECKLYGEGNIDLGQDLGQVKLFAYGNTRHDIPENETTLDMILMVDFYLSDPMLQLMAAEIDSVPNLEPVNLNSAVLNKTLNAVIGVETAQKLKDELSLFGTIKQIPPELRHTIVFNELKLQWNDMTNSYRSVGKIGIGSIGDVQINKRVDGFMELQIKRSGDIFDFYLEFDRRTYYYFGYTRGVMQTLSHNREYTETIMNMKTKERKKKVSRGETSYIYMISTDRKKNNFYRRWKDAVDGISTPDDE
ncbi:MAG: hypothetical protein JW894_15300 [Bacteroidales bacterium]|nr:hypothetical protein [Bacteroidales bacterium]